MTIESSYSQIHKLNSSYPEANSNVSEGDDHLRGIKTALRADWPPQGHIAGLTLSNDTDTDHDIAIAAGECADSGHDYLMKLSATLTKQIDAAWSAGDDAGGMFTGSVANDTWYHVFLIRKDSDGSIDAGFDTSVSAANIPSGYTAYRRIGSILTDGSANILEFMQEGDNFYWRAPVSDYAAAAQNGTPSASLTLTVPTGIQVVARVAVALGSSAGTSRYLLVLNPDMTDLAASSSNYSIQTSDSAAGYSAGQVVQVKTNTSAQLKYNATTTNIAIFMTQGWIDARV